MDSTLSSPIPQSGIYFCKSGPVCDVIAAADPETAALELVRRAAIRRERLGGIVWCSTAGFGDPQATPAATVGECLAELLQPQGVTP